MKGRGFGPLPEPRVALEVEGLAGHQCLWSLSQGRIHPGMPVPMSLEAKRGITPPICKLLNLGILRPCQSAWNTSLLPEKPNSNDYRPVQDLREVSGRVMDIHHSVPNPYTLLSSLPPEETGLPS